MTAATPTQPHLTSRLINGLLSIKPLAALAKNRARDMMIKRAERIGVPWRQRVQELQTLDWETRLNQIQNPQLQDLSHYPPYYLNTFHAYDQGNLSWEAALEVEVAALAVHSGIWKEAGAQGDAKLRQSHLDIVKSTLPTAPQAILDLGCSVGMSTFALQEYYPQAQLTGVDLSPYFLAVATYNAEQKAKAGQLPTPIQWRHAAAEATGLADESFDLVSIFLMCHELPQQPTREIFREVYRVLRPGGHLAIMDMNPQSEIYAQMPPPILTLLKSTEPYMDDYFSLDIAQALVESGFEAPQITPNSPRHRTAIARVKK